MKFLIIFIIISMAIFAFCRNSFAGEDSVSNLPLTLEKVHGQYLASISLADEKPKKEVPMATAYQPKQIVELEELLMSLVVQQGALIRLLEKKGIFSTEEFSEMVRVVGKEATPLSIKLPTPVEGR